MLREFSKELAEDRDFEIGGEVFRFRYPNWQEAAALWDEETQAVNANGDFSWKADTEMAIKRIPIFLDPMNDSHKRFGALVKRKTDPVPRHQIAQLYQWLVRVTSGLPMEPPSGSEPGGGASDDSSQEGSP